MARSTRFVPLLALLGLLARPEAVLAAPSPVPSAAASSAADAANRDAGTIDGIVTGVDVTPGKNKMTVKAAAQTYVFNVLAGTNVDGPTHDFAVDVKVGSHVAVSASKSGSTFTAQTVRVLPAAGHVNH